jgi:hypothetical protein
VPAATAQAPVAPAPPNVPPPPVQPGDENEDEDPLDDEDDSLGVVVQPEAEPPAAPKARNQRSTFDPRPKARR